MEKVIRRPLFLLALVFFILAAAFQFVFDRKLAHPAPERSRPTVLLLQPETLKKISFGFRNIIADALWIHLIQNFLAWHGSDIFPQYLDRITALDPKFEYPYLLGIMIIPRFGSMDDMQRIAERGMRALPDNWRIPFYLGAQFQVVSHDTDTARRYVDIAAQKSDSPQLVKRMQAAYAANAGDLAIAKALFATIHETAQEGETKVQAREWLERLELMEGLQRAIVRFKDKFGIFPNTIQELRDKGIVREIPADLQKLNLTIDTGGVLKIVR